MLGSGAPFASLLIKQLIRSMKALNRTWDELDLNTYTQFCCYVINEVKTIDYQTGGLPRVATISSRGFYELSEEEVALKYREFQQSIAEGLGKGLDSLGISRDATKKTLPSHDGN
jgi:hypothetical protein